MKTRIPMKLLAALTALCLLLSFGVFSAMAEALDDATPEAQALPIELTTALASGLAFDEDSSQFKILVMNDLTDGMLPYPTMLKYIEYVLEDTEPDLVVLNGDITRRAVSGFAANWSTIPWICGLLAKAEVPFTITFGENDAILPMSKNHYLTNYQKYDNCLAYEDARFAAGVANHSLFVFNDAEAAEAADLDGVAFNLWLMDSNSDGLVRTQSSWYAKKEFESIYLSTGYIIPSMLFTHLPLPEIQNVRSGKNLKTPYGGEMYRAMAPFGTMLPEIVPPEPTDIPSQAQPFVGVMAAVSGHYHTTLFDETWVNAENGYSLRFISRPSMSFLHRHGDRATRGASLITLELIDAAIPEEIEYEYIYQYELDEFDELVLDSDDQPILVLDENDEPIVLDVIETVVAYPVAPVVEIESVVHLPMFATYFDDDNVAIGKVGSRHAFYKAGVNWLFGPLSSLIGLCASLFADRYTVTFSVTQFFGDTFGFML